MRQKLLISILLLLSVVAPFAAFADSFKISPADLEIGKTGTLRFVLENATEYYGFQAEVTLPAGLEAVKGSNGKLDLTLSSRADGGEYQVNSNILDDGNLIIGAFSANHKPFSGNEGVLAELKVSVAESFTGGIVEVSKILFIDNLNQDVELASTSSKIGVAATAITLSETSSQLMVDETVSLIATVAPSSATDRTVTWSSSDETIATVDATGKVTAKALGEAAITAACGAVKAECKVTVIPTPVTGITLNNTALTLTVGDKTSLTATVAPSTATDKSVTWSSSDETVATVSASGEVEAVKDGSATITATSSNGKTATCTVSVKANIISVTGVTLGKTSLTLTEGDKASLTATVAPENATDKTVTWTSSDDDIATVSSTGEVTAVKAGTATITASSSNGMTATCAVTVEAKIIAPTGVTLDKTSADLNTGESVTLTATVAPADATDKSVIWSSSDENVATVDRTGKVTAFAGGTAVITVASVANPELTAACTVKVTVPVTGIVVLDENENAISTGKVIEINTGNEYNLTAVVTPTNATNKTVKWTTSDASVIKLLNDEGLISGLKAGEASVTASIEGFSVTVNFKVTDPFISVTGVTLDKTEIKDIVEGETAKLTATVLPADATDPKVTWSSSDVKVATVDQEGNVTAVAPGTATITATAGEKSATCTVTVIAKVIEVTGVTLDKTEIKDIVEGETAKLTATVLPADATDPKVTWSSSDVKVATVDQEGNVTAVAPGTATITATAGEKSATCTVTVIAKVIEVTGLQVLDGENQPLESGVVIPLHTGDNYNLTAVVLPANATDKKVTWTSSDVEVAEVDENGLIETHKAGEATITAKIAGFSFEAKVNVTDPVIPVTGVTLDKTIAEMLTGETLQLTATIAPADASSKEIGWSSSDNTIATVSAKGLVTALKAGKVTITATSNKIKATCEITITDPYVAVDGIALDKTEASMVEGESVTLKATVTPENATEPQVTWSSSDVKVATVDQEGNVTAVAPGTATITATAGEKSATCTVTVIAKVVEVTGLQVLDGENQPLESGVVIPLHTGDNYNLTAVVLPANATDKKVTWTSSDVEVAEVDENGLIETHKAGEATITAKIAGFSFVAKVNVTDPVIPVTGVTLDKTTAEMLTGETLQLTATIAPADASSKEIGWSSSDKTIATVSAKGLVTALKAGKVTITATANKISAKCEITITDPYVAVDGIALDKTEASMVEGESVTLKATVTPEDATEPQVTWSSSDVKVATVDQEGNVTAVAPGTATITATAGEKSATCVITVEAKVIEVTGVTLDKTEIKDIVEGETAKLTATVLPADATDSKVTWSSSDVKVATVDQEGNVTAVAPGTAIITAKAGEKTATCTVTVIAKVIEVTGLQVLDEENQPLESGVVIPLHTGDNYDLTAVVLPANATDKKVTWTSSDVEVAEVDENGLIETHKAGEATITAKIAGFTFVAKVNVTDPVIPVTGVTLDKTTAEMLTGETLQLTATIAPADASSKEIGWSSSDKTIATVSAKGLVTALKAGKVTITATANKISAKCEITITEPYVAVDGIALNETEASLVEGESVTLKATVTPEDATEPQVTWSSSDVKVATIDQEGNVTAVAPGTATITATAGEKSATCTVTVIAKVIEVTGLQVLDEENQPLESGVVIPLHTGDNYDLTAVVLPANATDKKVTWTSSDVEVAEVDENGLIETHKAGEATITAKIAGFTFVAKVNVTDPVIPVTGVTLDKTTAEMLTGETLQLTATIAPADASSKEIGWSSSDKTIATVSAKGLVTALKAGKVTITATANKISAKCEITITDPYVAVDGVALNETEARLVEGESLTLKATVTPEDATEPQVTWSSSDVKVATVDQEGNVTAVAPGTATITATAGEKSATCVITVEAKVIEVVEVTLDKTTAEMLTGETLQLTATIAPADASSKEIGWTSSDKTIATVSAKGLVTALKAGKVTITATANKISAKCEITITDPYVAVDGIALDKTEASMVEGESVTLKATVSPEDATDPKVTWSSSDVKVATVDQEGNVTAVAPGTATITAKAGEKSATCVITVEAKVIEVVEVTLDKTEAKILVGETLILVATVTPDDATDATVTWSSSDETIATVDEYGVVTGIASGDVTITATAGDKTAECKVKVDKVSGIELVGLDAEAPMKVFDLRGVYVSDKVENLRPGLYIIRQGNKSWKVNVR